jgi:uncharacterized membrane protein YdjX (TVP38/TMEM64 family)
MTLCGVGIWQLQYFIDVSPHGIRTLVEPLGWWGASLLGVSITVILLLPIIPATILQVGAGVIYGPWVGLGITLIADALGALIGFMMARRWGQQVIQRRLSPAEQVSFMALCHHVSPINIIVLRILPGPAYPLVSFAAGCSGLSTGRYLTSSLLGVAPALMLLTLAGDLSTHQPWLAALVTVVYVCVMILLNKIAQKYNKYL